VSNLSITNSDSADDALRVMADVQEIERLFRTYADACDDKYNPDKLAALFTHDATWSSSSESGTSDFGVHRGVDAIRKFFEGISKDIVFAHHIVMSPQVDILVPGERAKGRWNTIVLMRLSHGPLAEGTDEAKMISSVYTHDYRRENGVWLISNLNVHARFDTRLRLIG